MQNQNMKMAILQTDSTIFLKVKKSVKQGFCLIQKAS